MSELDCGVGAGECRTTRVRLQEILKGSIFNNYLCTILDGLHIISSCTNTLCPLILWFVSAGLRRVATSALGAFVVPFAIT